MPAVDCDPNLPPPIRSERCRAVAKPDDGGVVSGVSAGLVSALLSISRLTLTGHKLRGVKKFKRSGCRAFITDTTKI